MLQFRGGEERGWKDTQEVLWELLCVKIKGLEQSGIEERLAPIFRAAGSDPRQNHKDLFPSLYGGDAVPS